jgi:hypothetical protein
VAGTFIGSQKFFDDQDARGQFSVGRRMYLVREGDGDDFPNSSGDIDAADEPFPVSGKILDYLLDVFATNETTGDVVSFGFTKQNFFSTMARPAFDCVQ